VKGLKFAEKALCRFPLPLRFGQRTLTFPLARKKFFAAKVRKPFAGSERREHREAPSVKAFGFVGKFPYKTLPLSPTAFGKFWLNLQIGRD